MPAILPRLQVVNSTSIRYPGAMELPERIAIDPEIAFGKPVVRGTRLAVVFVLEMLAAGAPLEEVLESYPFLTPEDVFACLDYAAQLVKEQRVLPVPA